MDNSPLKMLPAELLNDIATLALSHSYKLNVLNIAESGREMEDSHDMADNECALIKHPAAFAQTCKQLHHDYMPIFYSNNTFMMEALVQDVTQCTIAFMNSIGPRNRSAKPPLFLNVFLGTCGIRNLDLTYMKATLTTVVHSLEALAWALRATIFAKSMHFMASFLLEGVEETEHYILLDCHDMKVSLAAEADRLRMANDEDDDFAFAERRVVEGLVPFLQKLSIDSRSQTNDRVADEQG